MRLAVSLAVVLASASLIDSAHASGDVSVSSGCTVSGKCSFSTTLYSAVTGGAVLANLAWVTRKVDVSELPADSATGRAKIDARRDTPSIHFVGYAPADTLQLRSKNDVTVVADHVWIRGGAELRVRQPSPGDFVVEVRHPNFAKLSAPLACGELALGTEGPIAVPTSPSKDFLFKAKSTPLYDAPGGKKIFTLEPTAPLKDFVVEIRESQGAWHHFKFVANEKIDGWLSAKDLVPYKEEVGDFFGAGGLGMSGSGSGVIPTPMVAAKDTVVWLDASKSGVVVGMLEKGAKVRALSAAPGFSTITLWDWDATAPAGKSFHVLTSDLKPAP